MSQFSFMLYLSKNIIDGVLNTHVHKLFQMYSIIFLVLFCSVILIQI